MWRSMCRNVQQSVDNTGWGKIHSVLSVGHCEGRCGLRRVELARKVQVVGKFPLQHSAVVKMVWSNEQRPFAVETYFSQSHSIVAVQRAFRTRYQIPPRDRVPDRKYILLWVQNFRETGSVSEKKMRTTTDLSNTREHRGLSDGPFCSLPGPLHANNGHHLQDILFKTM